MAGRTRVVYKSDAKYVISAPNAGYSGTTEGLSFVNGQAVIDPDAKWQSSVPGRTPEETLERIQTENPEYVVEEVPARYHTMPDTSDLRDETGALRTKKSKKAADAAE